MPHRNRSRQRRWGRRAIQSSLAIVILAIVVDYGKHVILKRALENEIAQSGGLVSLESLTVSCWPLFENQLVLKNFHVNISGTPLTAVEVHIRQGWKEWNFAHIQAKEVSSDETIRVQEAQGILDTKDLRTRVKVSQLILNGIHVTLPLITFSGSQASFDFLYDMTTHQLALKADAPEMAFPNGASFGLNGQGEIHTKAPMQGKMDVKIKNIDKMMKELVDAGVVKPSQAELVTSGSEFLGKIGLHDLTLPLRIQDGEVSLGPILLFKVGKVGSDLNTHQGS